MDFYFNKNTDLSVYLPHSLSVPVCPVTSFVENTPDPYLIDELTVLIPELEYLWQTIDFSCPFNFHLEDSSSDVDDFTYDGTFLTVPKMGDYIYYWRMIDYPTIESVPH